MSITIICNTCDYVWNTRPDLHVTGNKTGCPNCNVPKIYTEEYYKAKGIEDHVCYFYIVKFTSDEESFIKVGLTKHSNIKYRFRGLKVYNLEVLYFKQLTFFKCFQLEQDLLSKFSNFKYLPNHKFKGHTEVLNESCLKEVLSTVTEML